MEKKKIILIAVALFVIVCVYFIFEFFIGGLDNEEVVSNSDDYIVNDDFSTSNGEDGLNDGNNEVNTDNNVGDDGQNDISSSEDMINDENLDEKIYVYVTGEVNNSGVVILNEGARITDAINAAGGTTANADISKINLVYILTDGVKLNIPSFNDLKENPDFEYIILGSGEGSLNSENSSSLNGSYSVGSDKISGGSGSENSSSRQIVNINSASQTELELLPGIGPSLALKIIEYRNENGKFSKIEDIKNVKGIGDARFEDLKDFITV